MPAKLVHEGGGNLVGLRRAMDERLNLAPARLRDLDQRPERTRRVQRVAGTPKDPSRVPALVAEAPQERRLPNASFPRDEHEPAPSLFTHVIEQRGQRVQLALPLEELR